MKASYILGSVALAAMVMAGCKDNSTDNTQKMDQVSSRAVRLDNAAPAAKAVIKPSTASATQPSQGRVSGVLTLKTVEGGVQITGELDGLPPNSKHGFHIHDKGDLSAPDLSSAGGHFDPAGTHNHGGPGDTKAHHAGDLGNIEADANGKAHVDVLAKGVSLTGDHSIIGKSIIIHAVVDDEKGQPAGNAGARIAGGKIELSQ